MEFQKKLVNAKFLKKKPLLLKSGIWKGKGVIECIRLEILIYPFSEYRIPGAYGHIHTSEGKDISGNLMAIDISRKKVNINHGHYVKF